VKAGLKQMTKEKRSPCAMTDLANDAHKPAAVIERLEESLIESFEEAIDDGLHPAEAIACILYWAAGESLRMKLEERKVPLRVLS
jgi:hypothetical protein